MKLTKKVKSVVLVLLLIVAIYMIITWNRYHTKTDIVYKTQSIEQGDIKSEITSIGTVVAAEEVRINCLISGVITSVNVLPNAQVKRGDVLAEVDAIAYEANLAQAKSVFVKAKLSLREKQLTFKRMNNLYKKSLISKSKEESALNEYKLAEIEYEEAESKVKLANANLDSTKIISPRDGVIIEHNVSVGQQVGPNLSTQPLFSVVNDLSKLRLKTHIDEVDIGKVSLGLLANYTVDAYPNHIFKGSVEEIRLNAVTISNIVTYPVMIGVDNPDLKIKLGMTANIKIIAASKKNVIKIPNSAIGFVPSISPQSVNDAFSMENEERKINGNYEATVWVLRNDMAMPIQIRGGVDDGTYTEIVDGTLVHGDRIIVGEERQRGGQSDFIRDKIGSQFGFYK